METAVKETPRQTIRRRQDDPKLELSEDVSLKKGVTGVVLARYIPSSKPNEVCYIVEVMSDEDQSEPGIGPSA